MKQIQNIMSRETRTVVEFTGQNAEELKKMDIHIHAISDGTFRLEVCNITKEVRLEKICPGDLIVLAENGRHWMIGKTIAEMYWVEKMIF